MLRILCTFHVTLSCGHLPAWMPASARHTPRGAFLASFFSRTKRMMSPRSGKNSDAISNRRKPSSPGLFSHQWRSTLLQHFRRRGENTRRASSFPLPRWERARGAAEAGEGCFWRMLRILCTFHATLSCGHLPAWMPASARAYPPGSFSCFVLFADEKNDVPAKREIKRAGSHTCSSLSVTMIIYLSLSPRSLSTPSSIFSPT